MRGVLVDVVLVEEKAAPHLQQLVDADAPARITRCPPRRVVGDRRDVDAPFAHQNADGGVQHALRHRPGDVRRGRVEAVGVTLSDDRASVHDDHGVRGAETLRLGEGMVEGAIEEVAVHPAVELRTGPDLRRPRHVAGLRRQGGERVSVGFAPQGLFPPVDSRCGVRLV